MKLAEMIDWNIRTEDQQLDMVNNVVGGIRSIDNPSEAVQLAAVTRNGFSLEYIKNKHPSELVQLAAVKNYGFAIQWILNPSEAVQLAAVRQNPWSIRKIKSPSQSTIKSVLTNPNVFSVPNEYETLVKRFFKDNTMLMKKWLRYAEAMRNPQ
jgi:hypothetical protein